MQNIQLCAGDVTGCFPVLWEEGKFYDSADVCSRIALDSNFLAHCEKRSTSTSPHLFLQFNIHGSNPETGLSFCITPRRRTIPRRPLLTTIRSADNDFLLLPWWWEERPQRCWMHRLSELIDAGSQFVIKKEGEWLFIKSTVAQTDALPRSVALAEWRRATWQLLMFVRKKRRRDYSLLYLFYE